MLLSKAAIYFSEVARRGSIRHASEQLNIAASAVDRQILQLERHLDIPLYERLSSGIRLTAAGEMTVHAINRSRSEFDRLQSQLDDLRGLRRGEVKVAAAEGTVSVLGVAVCAMRASHPGVVVRIQIMNAAAVVDAVDAGLVDLGLTFNAPSLKTVSVAASLRFRMGAVVPPDDPIAGRASIALADCGTLPLVVPDDAISLRRVLDQAWAKTIGGHPAPAIETNSLAMVKSLVRGGAGIGMLTAIDVIDEVRRSELVFVPLSDAAVPLSTLTIISDQRRQMDKPTALLLEHVRENLFGLPGLAFDPGP